MALDDKMKSASVEVRRAVSGRSREPIGQVGRRAGLQRVVAFGAGALLIVVTVGAAALAALGGSDVELVPLGEEATTTVVSITTTAAPVAPTEISVTTTTITTNPTTAILDQGEGVSDPTGLPNDWLERIRGEYAEAHLLLMDDGIGMVAVYMHDPDYGDGWELFVDTAVRFEAGFRSGSDHDRSELPELVVGLAVDPDDTLVTVFGLVPLDARGVSISVGDADPIAMDRIYLRPDANRSVFRGSVPQSAFLIEPPVRVNAWITGPIGTEPSVFPVQIGAVTMQDRYDGPFTFDTFFDPGPLISRAATMEAFPEVVECENGERADTPPNQGRSVTDGAVFPSPVAALEAILDGELADASFPHGGYVAFTDSIGSVAFGVPFEGNPDQLLVMLIEVTEVEGGWAVTRWEGSGC